MLIEIDVIEAIDQMQVDVASLVTIAGKGSRPTYINTDKKVIKSRPITITTL